MMMTTTTNEMTLENLRQKWIGRKVRGSTQTTDYSPSRVIESIHLNDEDGKYYAWTGEHIRCNSLEALDRRLHSLSN